MRVNRKLADQQCRYVVGQVGFEEVHIIWRLRVYEPRNRVRRPELIPTEEKEHPVPLNGPADRSPEFVSPGNRQQPASQRIDLILKDVSRCELIVSVVFKQ